MKRSLFLLVLISVVYFSKAQVNQWVWLHGPNVVNDTGYHGVQGVPNNLNNPPALYEACQWTDMNGNFWLYGGLMPGTYSADDLWKYNPSTNQWTWMKGTDTQSDPGVYGVQGIPNPANHPPGLGYGSATWTDLNNNLWLLGGQTTWPSSDLWKYNISTNEWTWVKGPGNGGNYPGHRGTMGVPDTANYPSGRTETAAGWTDHNGDLWLFGGESLAGSLNDIWRYNIATNTWTWMKGDTLGFQFGHYGTKGVETALGKPGSRCVYSHWVDANGDLWLFGGFDGGGSEFNDVWRYRISTNNWTWMGGTNVISGPASIGTRCLPDPTNVPSPRFENRASWKDAHGDFWTFGGGYSNHFDSTWSEIWKYCVASNEWIYEGGDTLTNPTGSWGTRGVSSPTNTPNGRAGAPGWSDNNGHFYFFGGSSSPYPKYYNDLWMYTMDTSCGSCLLALPPVANFNSSDTAFCDETGRCISFFDHSTNNPTSWQWLFPGAMPDTSSQQNPTNICYTIPGTYPVTLIATNGAGSDTFFVSPMITLGTTPAAPTLTISNDTLFCSHETTYQWYFNGAPIAGATNSFYVYTSNGSYDVFITDSLGCGRFGSAIFTATNEVASTTSEFQIHPNPVESQLTISSWQFANCQLPHCQFALDIYNVLGEKIFTRLIQQKNLKTEIDVSALSSGIYFMKIYNEKKNYVFKFVKK